MANRTGHEEEPLGKYILINQVIAIEAYLWRAKDHLGRDQSKQFNTAHWIELAEDLLKELKQQIKG